MTHQTPEGKVVQTLLIEEGCEIDQEYYLGIVLDRVTSRITMMASSEGGVEIEKVAEETPEKIIKVAIDPASGFTPFVGRKLAYNIGMKGDQIKEAIKSLRVYITYLFRVIVQSLKSIL